MSCTPDYDAHEDIVSARLRDELRRLMQPIFLQRDQLASELVGLRKERNELQARLNWYTTGGMDSSHDPDHGAERATLK